MNNGPVQTTPPLVVPPGNIQIPGGGLQFPPGFNPGINEAVRHHIRLYVAAKVAIDAKAAALGSWIGPSLVGDNVDLSGKGHNRRYQNATIWAVEDNAPLAERKIIGAWEVHGSIRVLYEQLNQGQSVIGVPITDETPTIDGRGRFNRFDHGVIFWSPDTGAHEVHGDILRRWEALGFERSWLGYPLTNQLAVPNAQMNSFQNGQIIWRNGPLQEISYRDTILQRMNALGRWASPLGIPVSRDLPVFRRGNDHVMSFRGGEILVPLDAPAPVATQTTKIRVTWTGLECKVRQEGEDELAGAVTCYAQATGKTFKDGAFPSGNEPWKLGNSGARIMPTSLVIYEGPPSDVLITTSLVELDRNSSTAIKIANAVKDAAVAIYENTTLKNNQILPDDPWGREGPNPTELLKKALDKGLIEDIITFFAGANDPYRPGFITLRWDQMRQNSWPKKILTRPDDANAVVWTDEVTVTGTDGGGDPGVYTFYFNVDVIDGNTRV